MIADRRLRELPIYGVFHAGDTDGILSGLEQSLPLRLLRQRGRTLLKRSIP